MSDPNTNILTIAGDLATMNKIYSYTFPKNVKNSIYVVTPAFQKDVESGYEDDNKILSVCVTLIISNEATINDINKTAGSKSIVMTYDGQSDQDNERPVSTYDIPFKYTDADKDYKEICCSHSVINIDKNGVVTMDSERHVTTVGHSRNESVREASSVVSIQVGNTETLTPVVMRDKLNGLSYKCTLAENSTLTLGNVRNQNVRFYIHLDSWVNTDDIRKVLIKFSAQ